jgi:galactose mutarotase-like enzyme
VQIANAHLAVEIDSHGAELRSVRTSDTSEWLWNGDPAFWAGRSPLLFPVIGKSPNGCVSIEGVTYAMLPHGFARNLDFSIEAMDKDWVQLSLTESDATRVSFPFSFRLTLTYSLLGSSIRCLARVANNDRRPMPFQFGFHPGLVWPLPNSAGKRHVVTLGNAAEPALHRLDKNLLLDDRELASPFSAGRLVPERAMFDEDAMLFLSGAGDSFCFAAEGGAKVEMKTVNLPHFAIWQQPGAPFLCLEPWHGTEPFAGTGNSLETRHGSVRLEPREQMEFQMDLRLTPAPPAS